MLTAGQKKRVWLLTGLVVCSLLILLPTVIAALGDKAPTVFSGDSALPKWWPAEKLKLGLDLRGGSYLTLAVQTPEAVKSQLTAIAQALKDELKKEKAGVVRAKQVGEREIEVILLREEGVSALERYVREEYPFLESTQTTRDGSRVKVTYSINDAKAEEIQQNSVVQAIETIRNRVDQYGVTEPTIQRSGNDRIMVQLPDIKNIDSVKQTIGSVAKLEFRLAAEGARAAVDTIERKSRDGGTILLEDEVLMTGDAIESANVEIDPNSTGMEVSFRLNSIGAKTFGRITSANIGRRLAIVLDNVVQSDPVIRGRITNSGVITGDFSPEEAHRLAIVLRSGALPAPLLVAEERTVGASLGQDAIHSGIVASILGAAVVFVFTIFYYRKAGMLAVASLVLNLVFLISLLALFNATLTLPGIAGLALTIGMAVDANVIIYERIREELRRGSTGKAAVEAGYLHAHWTIMDANLTTLLSGIVLYFFGTGPIKGFAVTLSVGILTTLFCALFVCRLGFDVLNMKTRDNKISI